jgi:hypothetical protein
MGDNATDHMVYICDLESLGISERFWGSVSDFLNTKLY